MLEQFIDYLNAQVTNHSIYVYGAQGEQYPIINENWISKMEKDPAKRTTILKTYKKAVNEGFKKKLRAFDCSGLGMYFLYNLKKIFGSDKTADGMKASCTAITKKQLKKGDWVFRIYTSGAKKGIAYHVGYVVDNDLNVVEAQGRAYGVVKRSINKSGSTYWNYFGRPKCFSSEIETKDSTFVFTRILKKTMKGNDVSELQKLLNKNGGAVLKIDGDFGVKTDTALREFQKRKRLIVDGKAGKNTITKLGGSFISK